MSEQSGGRRRADQKKAFASTASRRRPARRPCSLVRHGESAAERPGPAVPAPGRPRRSRARSGRRASRPSCSPSACEHEPIAAIYVTTLRRTHQTAAPLAAALGLDADRGARPARGVPRRVGRGRVPRAARVADDPIFEQIFRAGALGRDSRRRAARRIRRARVARLPAHRRRASRRARGGRRRTAA